MLATTPELLESPAAIALLTTSTRSRPSRLKRPRMSRPTTFRRNSLEDSFLKFCQLSTQTGLRQLSPPEFAALNSEANHFIDNPEFQSPDASSEILGDELLSDCRQVATATRSRSSGLLNLPPHLVGLCKDALLTREQERALFRRMNYLRFLAAGILASKTEETATQWDIERARGLLRAATWHRDIIVCANTRLVVSIVKKFVNQHCSFDDLLSDGVMALMRSVDKFDYQLGFRFSTYATQVVRRNSYRLVMDRQDERLKVANSLSEHGFDVAEDCDPSSMTEYRWGMLRTHLFGLLDQLDRREKLIIRARFSLGSHSKVQTLQYLADRLGISKERVRQVEKRALEKLQALAQDSPPEVAEVD